MRLIKRFASADSGTTSIEYSVIAMVIAVAAIGGFTALGDSERASWATTAKTASDAMNK